MLDQEDLVVIREIVAEEISGKTSDLRQDVSTLQQDFRQFGVLMEDQTKLIKLVLENVVQNNKFTEKVPSIEDTLANHEIRIKGLEFSKKKTA